MNTKLCRELEIEFPLFAFSHCRDVVAAVSRAGGMGVFGAVNYTPKQLSLELNWIDAHIGKKPYGLDLIVPNKIGGIENIHSADALIKSLPEEHQAFTVGLLKKYGVDVTGLDKRLSEITHFASNLDEAGAGEMLEVAFEFPVKLIANALGTPPKIMLEMAHQRGVPVAALVGSRKHAEAQVAVGVDFLVAVGGEAGGHCGEISTMVLLPEILSVAGDIPVLAAGGIVTGRQMAAAMAMGAAGAWCGSVWLTTAEAEPAPAIKEKLVAASSSDTVRSRSRTGKPSRQLRSPWTDAWEDKDAPTPLPMPLQSLVSEPALKIIESFTETGHEGARTLATYWVGQGVGLMKEEKSTGTVVQDFKEDYLEAVERLSSTLEEI